MKGSKAGANVVRRFPVEKLANRRQGALAPPFIM
ncbi:MAG: hypothetical protein QOH48_2421 [Actinomycetota bacterium]|jgi:hypothetical protein|nr:hypothetical protein [Actinomycetota bacterium]